MRRATHPWLPVFRLRGYASGRPARILMDADIFASSRRVRNRPVFLLWDSVHFGSLRGSTAELAGSGSEFAEDGIARISKGARRVSNSPEQSNRRHQEAISERRISGPRPTGARWGCPLCFTRRQELWSAVSHQSRQRQSAW